MDNMDQLVDKITAEILRRMKEKIQEAQAEEQATKRFLVLGKDPHCEIAALLGQTYQADVKPNLHDAQDYDFVVMPVSFLSRLGTKSTAKPEACSVVPEVAAQDHVLDLTEKKLLHERELMERCSARTGSIRIGKRAIVTHLAMDYLKKQGITVVRVDS